MPFPALTAAYDERPLCEHAARQPPFRAALSSAPAHPPARERFARPLAPSYPLLPPPVSHCRGVSVKWDIDAVGEGTSCVGDDQWVGGWVGR